MSVNAVVGASRRARIIDWLAVGCATGFIGILAIAAYWDRSIRVLHLFEALLYAAVAILCVRQQKFGYILGAASGAFWLWMAGTLTTFVRNGFERIALLIETGHVDRVDVLIAAPAACLTGGLVLFSLWGYFATQNRSVRDLGLGVVALGFVAGYFIAIFAAFSPHYLQIFRPLFMGFRFGIRG